jgi:hypothetical protein
MSPYRCPFDGGRSVPGVPDRSGPALSAPSWMAPIWKAPATTMRKMPMASTDQSKGRKAEDHGVEATAGKVLAVLDVIGGIIVMTAFISVMT